MADKNMWPHPASYLFQKVPLLNAKFSFRSVMAHWKMLSPSLIKTPQQSSPEMGIQCRVALACMQWSCQSKVWNFLSNLFRSLKWLYGDYHYSGPEELTIEDVSLCLWCHSSHLLKKRTAAINSHNVLPRHWSLGFNAYSWDVLTTKKAPKNPTIAWLYHSSILTKTSLGLFWLPKISSGSIPYWAASHCCGGVSHHKLQWNGKKKM